MTGKPDPGQSNKRRQLRRLMIGGAILMVAWTMIDEFRPNWFKAAKVVADLGHGQTLTVSGPTTVEIGSLLVDLPKGETFIGRFPVTLDPWSRWKPKTRQWAHLISGLHRDVLGPVAKETIYMLGADFTLRARGNAAEKSYSCQASKIRNNGGVEGSVIRSPYKMYDDFRSVATDGGEWLISRQRRMFLGHEIVFLRRSTEDGGLLPGSASLVLQVAVAPEVTFYLHIRDADIDGPTFWVALQKIEAAIKHMLRRVDGHPLELSAALCDARPLDQPPKTP